MICVSLRVNFVLKSTTLLLLCSYHVLKWELFILDSIILFLCFARSKFCSKISRFSMGIALTIARTARLTLYGTFFTIYCYSWKCVCLFFVVSERGYTYHDVCLLFIIFLHDEIKIAGFCFAFCCFISGFFSARSWILRSVIIHPFSILNSVNLDVDRKISSKIIRIYTFLDITKWESW